ncbi:MAG: cyclic nucleotide-binding domain-containing protein [Kiritimatiellae bacterium]|nr:cyclic nucleotide-binding domain-containing protein [Kiritimatiellia bacterium]MDD5523029.1 cyclic nucleotide-binding domain-containing protein [Kiritimatiellia bacterium]
MLLDNLTDEEQALVAEICRIRECKCDDSVVSEGDRGGSILFIRKGRAEVRKSLGKNNHKFLRELHAGEFFGEMCFLNNVPRSASVVALEDCEILELNGADFDKLVRKYPEIGLKVYKNIASELVDRLRRNNEELKKAVLWAIEGTDPR